MSVFMVERDLKGISLEALGGAQKAAMAAVRSQYPHPFHWAPFFLTGRPVRKPEAMTTDVVADVPALAGSAR